MNTSQINTSVIIPAYNEENVIEACLQSLARQTIAPHEIIVVDNNCTDSTVEIAKKYGVVVVTETKQGIAPGRTKGFDVATGTVLARIDADSKVAHDWIEKIQHNFQKHPDIVGIAGSTGIEELSPGSHVWFRWTSHIRRWIQRQTLGINETIMYGHNMIITKDLWKKIRDDVQTDETLYHEDLDISFAAWRHGEILYDPHVAVSIPIRRFLSLKKIKFYSKKDKATVQKYGLGKTI